MLLNLKKDFTDLIKRESFRKILRSIQYLSAERIIKLIVGLIIHAWLARYLGPEKFGRLSYIINFTAIFIPFVTFGLDDVLTKSFLEKKHDFKDIVTTQIALRLIVGGFGYLILILLVSLDPQFEFKYKLMIILYGATLFLRVFDVIEIFYQSVLNLRPVFWARNISYLSSSFFKLIGIYLKSSLSFFLATYLWEVFIWKTISVLTYFREFRFGSINKDHRSHFIKEALPLFWGAFIVMLDFKLANIMLKKIHGDESVGNFSIVMILVELWNFLPAAICASLYPAIFNSKTGKSGDYGNRVQLLYDFLFWLGLVFAVCVTLSSSVVVGVLYGNKFPELPGLLTLASWVGIMSFLSFGRVKYFVLEDKISTWVLLSVVSLLANATMQSYLVPQYHEQGAILSMLISPYISLLLCSTFSSFVRKESVLILNSVLAPIRHAFKRLS